MDLFPIVSKLYPEGSKQGQCAVYTERLTDMPLVGFFISSKRAAIAKYGIPRDQMGPLQVGDVVITSDGLVGHTALVIKKPTPTTSQLSESNWNLDGRVHHTRVIADDYKNIIGVFRNCHFKFNVPQDTPMPTPAFNIPLRVKLVINNQPDWKSLTQHAYNFIHYIYTASGAHILPVVDWSFVSLPNNWDTQYVPIQVNNESGVPVTDYEEMITESWMQKNVLPLGAGFDVVMFVVSKNDWKGKVFNQPHAVERGYAFEHTGGNFPACILLVSDEHDDFPPYYPSPLSAFAKLMVHELDHILYGVCPNAAVVIPGGDYCHRRWFAENNPDACFKTDFDYEKLNTFIKR